MKGHFILYVFLLKTISAQECWESCLSGVTSDYLKSKLTNAAHEIQYLTNKYSVDGLTFLLDRTLRQKSHDPTMNTNLDFDDDGTNIFNYQKDLTYILSHMSGGSFPKYLTSFNQNSAKSCSALNCLDSCELGLALDELMPEYGPDSDRDGAVEHACKMSSYYMTNGACDSMNRMSILVANSDIHEHIRDSSSSEEDRSNCKQNFPTRMAIGTHSIDSDELDDFQSSDPWYYEIRDSESYMMDASALRSCIATACCTGAESIGALDDCKETDPLDHDGDTIV